MPGVSPPPRHHTSRGSYAKLVKFFDMTGEYADKHIGSPTILGIVGLCEGFIRSRREVPVWHRRECWGLFAWL